MSIPLRVFFFLMFLSIGALLTGPMLQTRADDGDERFWSFRPVRSVVAPPVRDHEWTKSPVDAFILAKLEERGLRPAPLADKRTLIRRATFDLTGLPPTPEDVDAFLQDDSVDAFAKVVDRLLDSACYGERWGRHWLDVVRYADARDLIQLPAESDFREAWRYRDWVVKSFNRDLPYDQFIRQQVAGDLMQPADKNQIDADALVATGMLAIADFVPGDVDKKQMIADYVNDQIDVVGRAVLGLTLACARCHDHKFDPISIEDYYSLAGIFFSSRLIPGPVKGNTPLTRVALLPPAEIAAIEAGEAQDKLRIAELSREISQFADREYRAYLEKKVDREIQKYLLAAWEVIHSSTSGARFDLAEFAKKSGVDEGALKSWIDYLEVKPVHSALAALLGTSDKVMAEQQVGELSAKLAEFVTTRRVAVAGDASLKLLADSQVVQFRADDRRLVMNSNRQVTYWPNRDCLPANAFPVPAVTPPQLATASINGSDKQVLHFSGGELLQTPKTVPPTGSLFVVFRPDSTGGAGQRLVGWEDSATGQHGLGIMTDAAGSMHLILRRNGANGDVVVPAPTASSVTSGFQLLCVTWGPNGVAAYRDGQSAGTNKGIDSVSSDAAIASLMIGGPGSGSSARFHGDIAELRVYSAPLDDAARTRVEAELTRRWFSPADGSIKIDPIGDLYEELVSGQSPFRLEPEAREKALSEDDRRRLTSFRDELEKLNKKPKQEIPRAVVVQEGGPVDTPHAGFRDAQVYLRGNHANPGKTVPRGFPKAVMGIESAPIGEGSGRREMAAWLADPQNPLTARVMVNRVWQHHFGVGLVPTSANFGAMGDSPSHPELLDFLASRFVESGWSVKAIHRLIMLSNVYQQNSLPDADGIAVDPENKLLWRSNRRRLEAESFRDSLLAVAGRLDLTQRGLGFQDAAIPRRSLYLMSVRTGAKTAEFGPLFDGPDCSGIVERRTESIVAPQALFLMNDPLVTELAKGLGDRVKEEVTNGDVRDRIRRLYEIALGRLPTEGEFEVGSTLIADPSQPDAWVRYCRLVMSTNEFMFVD